jgi:hypothetical protein
MIRIDPQGRGIRHATGQFLRARDQKEPSFVTERILCISNMEWPNHRRRRSTGTSRGPVINIQLPIGISHGQWNGHLEQNTVILRNRPGLPLSIISVPKSIRDGKISNAIVRRAVSLSGC